MCRRTRDRVGPRRSPDLAQRQRLPGGDGPGIYSRLSIVGNARKPAAQLDSGRELAALVECGTDRRSICLGDDEHNTSMGTPVRIGKLFSGWRTANSEMVFELPMLHEGRPLCRILCPTVLSSTPGIRGIGCCQEGERAPKRQGMPREQRAGACKSSRRGGSLCAPDKLRLAIMLAAECRATPTCGAPL